MHRNFDRSDRLRVSPELGLVALFTFVLFASFLSGAKGQTVVGGLRFDHTELDVYYDLADYFEFLRQRRIARVGGIVEVARETLHEAERKARSSHRELNVAWAKIKMAELDRQEAELEEAAAIHARCRIEAEILSKQDRESAIERARTELAARRLELDRELHRVIPRLPPHSGKPTAADYLHETALLGDADDKILENDALYQQTRRRVYEAYGELDRCRREVFKKDPAWVQANEKEAAAHDREREAEKRVVRANAGTLSDKLTMHSAERAAEKARLVIARGRAIIRELGGDPGPRPKDPPKKLPQQKSAAKKHKPSSKKYR